VVRLRRTARDAALVLAVAMAPVASAQDSHYWSFGYGPIGQLTEGTLVGGVSDLSAAYYNPAACALIDQPRFVFNMSSVDISRLDLPDAAGPDLNVDRVVGLFVPAMLAFHLGRHDEARNHFAFAFLSRYRSDLDADFASVSVSAESPSGSAGFGRYRRRVHEYWVGGDWSRALGHDVSVGVSPFFAYRGQRDRRSLTVEELSPSSSEAAFVGKQNDYDHVRLLAKAGVAWRPGRWQLGATLTAPGFKLWSRGKQLFNASVSGPGTGLLSALGAKGLPATYHAPWAAAFGATRRRENGAIHATVEWFSTVAAYDILPPAEAPVVGRPETIPVTFQGEAPSVVNYGLGFEQRLSDSLKGYGGVARNHSVYVPARDSFQPWDLTDVTLGISLDRGRSRLALGVGYAWGTGELQQLIAPPDETGPLPSVSANYYRFRFSFGASFLKK